MKQCQKYSPKYWVVHDKNSDDVYISTCRKSQRDSIEAFFGIGQLVYNYFGTIRDEDLYELFYEHEDLECTLVEVNFTKEKQTITINRPKG